MESHAHTTNYVTGISPCVLYSSKDHWNDFKIERRRWLPTVLQHHANRHTLTFHSGEPMPVAWREDGQWKKSVCKPGNIVRLQSPGHDGKLQCEETLEIWEITFQSAFLDRFMQRENFMFRQQHNVEDRYLTDICMSIFAQLENSPIEKMHIESLVIAAVIHLGLRYSSSGRKMFAPKGKLSSVQLKRAIDFAHEYIQSDISLTSLAEAVHLSTFHFARLFRQTLGISPYQYILQLKIDYAKRLIRQHKLSLSDVAYSLRFTDQAHFSNTFKKITGVSPRKFVQNPVS